MTDRNPFFSEEHQLFQDSVRKFVAKEAPREKVRECRRRRADEPLRSPGSPIVALCREMRHNASMSSVRISRSLLELAKTEAEAMHRSLAGQIEHWAELGRAIEALGLSVEDAKSLFYRARIERDDPFLKLLKSSDSPIQQVHTAVLRDAKRARQAIDYEAQKRGWVSHSQMSPFAGVNIKAHIREVPLD